MSLLWTGLAAGVSSLVAWFLANFVGKPILAIREKRREALNVTERYAGVGPMSSDELRDKASKSLNDVANDLSAYSRERAIGT
jgi:hypothetical protein